MDHFWRIHPALKDGHGGDVETESLLPERQEMSINDLFDKSAARFLDIIPMQTRLQDFPTDIVGDIFKFEDSQHAMIGKLSASAWKDSNGNIVLTARCAYSKNKTGAGGRAVGA